MEGAPIPKRMRLACSSVGKSKACIVLYCFEACRGFRHLTRLECNVCVVDLKSDALAGGSSGDGDDAGYARVFPTLQIDYGGGDLVNEDAFCVLGGKKLYVLEGDYDGVGKKSVFAFDLESSSSQTLFISTTKGGPSLEKVGDMLSPKLFPVALPTPDGKKMVVFSASDPRWLPAPEPPVGDFELFDPEDPGCPERLPQIGGDVQMLYIEQYGFIQGTDKLAVKVFSHGIYVLDLSSPDRDWTKLGPIYADVELVPLNFSFGAPPSLFETVEGGRFCFVNRYGFFDLEEWAGGKGDNEELGYNVGFVTPEGEGYTLGRSRRDGRPFNLDFMVARCLNGDEGEKEGKYHVCNLTVERLKDYVGFCRMELDVCRVDLKSYKEVSGDERFSLSSKVANTTLIKKHKFSLDFGGKRYLDVMPHPFFTF